LPFKLLCGPETIGSTIHTPLSGGLHQFYTLPFKLLCGPETIGSTIHTPLSGGLHQFYKNV
jgi:hypothetical protein